MNGSKQVKRIPDFFDKADSVEEIAKELIPKYHTHLINSRIAYLFKNKELKKAGKTVIATANKCSPKEQALKAYDGEDPFDFVIIVSYPIWNKLNEHQKEAIIDHELCHCWVEEIESDSEEAGDKKNKILAHDYEEFGSVLDRHGTYLPDLIKMKEILDSK